MAFEFPLRTTAWGSIEPYANLRPPESDAAPMRELCSELEPK